MFERIATEFLKEQTAAVRFPLSTADLWSLLKRGVRDLDQHTDSSKFGNRFEGITEFFYRGKPRVTIAGKLVRREKYANRLRTALAHEYDHVQLHAHLCKIGQVRTSTSMVDSEKRSIVIRCRRKTMIDAAPSNWMEWQASYACGALLMPMTYVKRLTPNYLAINGLEGLVASDSAHGEALICMVVEEFEVSRDAARVRLEALNILGSPAGTMIPYLFP